MVNMQSTGAAPLVRRRREELVGIFRNIALFSFSGKIPERQDAFRPGTLCRAIPCLSLGELLNLVNLGRAPGRCGGIAAGDKDYIAGEVFLPSAGGCALESRDLSDGRPAGIGAGRYLQLRQADLVGYFCLAGLQRPTKPGFYQALLSSSERLSHLGFRLAAQRAGKKMALFAQAMGTKPMHPGPTYCGVNPAVRKGNPTLAKGRAHAQPGLRIVVPAIVCLIKGPDDPAAHLAGWHGPARAMHRHYRAVACPPQLSTLRRRQSAALRPGQRLAPLSL